MTQTDLANRMALNQSYLSAAEGRRSGTLLRRNGVVLFPRSEPTRVANRSDRNCWRFDEVKPHDPIPSTTFPSRPLCGQFKLTDRK
jgi:hypothetical protein